MNIGNFGFSLDSLLDASTVSVLLDAYKWVLEAPNPQAFLDPQGWGLTGLPQSREKHAQRDADVGDTRSS